MALAATNDGSLVIKPKADPVAEMKKMQLTRGGGTYIPPHRLRAMMAEQEAEDKEGEGFQRMAWDALRKSINGLINKVNVANIKLLVPEVSPASSCTFDFAMILILSTSSLSCSGRTWSEAEVSLFNPSCALKHLPFPSPRSSPPSSPSSTRSFRRSVNCF